MKHSGPTTILIADDHPILRKTLSAYLAHEADIAVIGELGDSHRLVETVRRQQPDILLLDVNMPGPPIVEQVRALHACCPDVHILVLSAEKVQPQVVALVQAGISGYVLKEDNPRDLLNAIRAVAAGEEWFSPAVTHIVVRSLRVHALQTEISLTDRELDVLQLMVTGADNDTIATKLVISTNTVKNHVRHIFRKLDVSTRVEAVVFALNNHLVEPPHNDP